MMSRRERFAWVLSRRKDIEMHVHDADLAVGIAKRHLAEADRLLNELDDAKKRQGNYGNRLMPLQALQIQKRVGRGESDRKIAREFGVSPATVSKFKGRSTA